MVSGDAGMSIVPPVRGAPGGQDAWAARALTAGGAQGDVLKLSVPLSFWGGLEAASGRIIDRSHPDCGAEVSGRILVMPGGRGSSSSSAVLAEALRLGSGPAGIVLSVEDPIITVGALVAARLYGIACPVIVVADAEAFAAVGLCRVLRIEAEGARARIIRLP